MIDARGTAVSHTGSRNIRAAGSRVGRWYAAQANLMTRPTVWDAMGRAFETTRGDLAERLLAALEAAEREGGDIRGRQSAALVVVSGDRSLPPWDRVFDLRVEDSRDPLGELRRLVRVARAYQAANRGDEWMTRGNVDSALASYAAAEQILPDSAVNGELVYWRAVTLADRGRVDEALPYFRRAFAQDTAWAALLWRLPRAGLLHADSATIARIIREARRAR
jgi:tetratricopeptide (TPR) repeat protein